MTLPNHCNCMLVSFSRVYSMSTRTDLWCVFPIEHKGMEELCTRDWHQQPAAEPPRTIFQPALRVHNIIKELQTPSSRVDRHGQPKLVLGADPQSETCRACAHGRGKPRCQRTRDARISLTERFRIFGTEIRSNADEETVKKAME